MKNFAALMMLIFVLGLTVGCGDGAKTEVVGGEGGIPAEAQAEFDNYEAEQAAREKAESEQGN
jgi:hypothetical protein